MTPQPSMHSVRHTWYDGTRSVVSSATLALVADPRNHDVLVDLPFRTGLVSGFGLVDLMSSVDETHMYDEERNAATHR